ncbi:MAG: hypothetical protein WC867_01975 [Candidatus Pacearchaeota archaeon]|jgi:hypothetical protein
MQKGLISFIILGSSLLPTISNAQESFIRRFTRVQTAEYRFNQNQNNQNNPALQPPSNPVNERGIPYYKPSQQNYQRNIPQARPAEFQNPYDSNIWDPTPMNINSPEFKEHQNDLREYYFPNNPELQGSNYGRQVQPREMPKVPNMQQNNNQFVPDNPYLRYQQWYAKLWSDSFDRMQKSQDPRYSSEERQRFIDLENEARSRFNSEDAKWQVEINRFNQYIESQRQRNQLPTIQNQNIENRTIIIHGNNNRVYQR